MSESDPLLGRRMLNLPRLSCPHHPKAPMVIGAGKGPHAYRADCGDCGRFVGWLSKKTAASVSSAFRILD